MTFEELLTNPFVLLAIGWAAAEFRRSRAGQDKSLQVDTDLKARVQTLEQWQRDHNSIHGCVQRLAATSEGMAKNVDRLTRRIDMFMSYFPPPQSPAGRRSPFDFPGAREWVNEEAAA